MSGAALSPAEIQRTRDLAAQGLTPHAAAKELGIAPTTLHHRANKHGIRFETAADQRYRKFQGYAARGLTIAEMAHEAGITCTAVKDYLHYHPEFRPDAKVEASAPVFSCKPEAIARALRRLPTSP